MTVFLCYPVFKLPAGFMFFEFSYQTQVGLVFSVKLPILGLFFKFASLFLQNSLAPLFYSLFKSITLGTLFQI